MITRKKLIEVALPLEKINLASAREKSIRHGHPSTLHLWWARRPLAAARAVIFAQMVDDPSEYVAELRRDPVAYTQAQRTLTEQMAAWTIRRRSFEATPVAGERAVLDPGQAPTLEECLADNERQRLFRLIEQLVLWENTTNEDILQQARDEIWRSWRRTCADNHDHPRAAELFNPEKLPAFHDPFAGGGALPLEAQRLGLESYASDLNPVAVLINKAMIEIPPKFSGRPPVNPDLRFEIFDVRLEGKQSKIQNPKSQITWKGAAGLAADVRYYGQWMRDEAEKRIGHLYPKVQAIRNPDGSYRHATQEEIQNPQSQIENLTVIAWLWARTVNSPNPAFAHVAVPLASTFMLSTKPGKETYVEPVIDGDSYRFTVKVGKPKDAEAAKNGTKLARANFVCLMSGTPIDGDYIKAEGMAGRIGARLMAIVAEGQRGRIYLAPTPDHEALAHQAKPEWEPDVEFFQHALGFRVGNYGMKKWSDLFTARQLVVLTTLADLVNEVSERVRRDESASNFREDDYFDSESEMIGLVYSDAVCLYLGLAVSKLSDYNGSLVQWSVSRDQAVHVFGRQALPMVWDFAEINPFSGAAGDLGTSLAGICRTVDTFGLNGMGVVVMADAQKQTISKNRCISTDPPYYDNIGYADLSDYFYVWLRRSLKSIVPDVFATLTVPKAEELVATPDRHGGKKLAEAFFLNGMTHAMQRLAEQAHPAFPVTIYYAFKQSETDSDQGVSSTGWEAFLEAVIRSGFALVGTWPMRTEKPGRMRENDSNALASSVILVCRPRPANAPTVTRRDFLAALKEELPVALANMQRGNIAPVDLAQASIGPGMGVFTRYGKVIDATGKALTVREALTLINQSLDEVLAEQEGDFDADTRWALAWFEQYGFAEGEYGVAETLSKAKNTSVAGMVTAGILASGAGKVRLLRPEELPANWNPDDDARLTVWEMVHHLVRALSVGNEASESAAGKLLAQLGARADIARELAYRLYALCERKKRAAEALAYNGLVQSWPEMLTLAQAQRRDAPVQLGF